MSSKMDEFRSFVSKHPEVRDNVLSGKKTWQQLYEDWVILGEESDVWEFNQNKTVKEEPKKSAPTTKLEDLFSSDNLKTIVGYIKKINPDTLSKTLNTIQKVLQITQGLGGGTSNSIYNASYNSWWD